MEKAAVLGAALAASTLFIALLTLPRWFVGGLQRYRLWRFRDHVVDAMLSGRLPRHPAVEELVHDTESAIDGIKYLTPWSVLMLRRMVGRLGPDAAEAHAAMYAMCDLEGLDSDERDVVVRYRRRLVELVTGIVVTSSWTGVAILLVYLPRAIRKVPEERPSGTSGTAIGLATDAAAHTSLGRKVEVAVAAGLAAA